MKIASTLCCKSSYHTTTSALGLISRKDSLYELLIIQDKSWGSALGFIHDLTQRCQHYMLIMNYHAYLARYCSLDLCLRVL